MGGFHPGGKINARGRPFRHFAQRAKCHLPHLALPNGGGKGFPCHFDRGSEATEWRNLLDKPVGSQIPPLAALGRDDKGGNGGGKGCRDRARSFDIFASQIRYMPRGIRYDIHPSCPQTYRIEDISSPKWAYRTSGRMYNHEPPVKTGGLLLAISPCCQLASQDAACTSSKLSVSPYFMPLKGLLTLKRIFVFLYTQLIYCYIILLLILYVLPDCGFV